MRQLPLTLRWYLWTVYALCSLLVARQLAILTLWRPLHGDPFAVLQSAAIFAALAYAGEQTRLQVSGSVSQTLATAVHIAIILLFPPPFPLLITLLGALVSQIVHERSPLYKRAFNICHPVLTVGISSGIFSLVAAHATLLRQGDIGQAIPALALLMALYYLLDVGTMLCLLVLLQGQTPWRVWWQTYRRTLLPELATGTIGIIAAVTWQFDHILLVLFVLPVVALGVAFRAIAAEDRARALRRRGEQLEAVLAAGQRLRLQHTQVDLLYPVAEAARSLVGATTVAAYLRNEEDPPMLERVALIPAEAGSRGPACLPIPVPGTGVQYLDDDGRMLLVPLELESVGVTGLLRLGGVPAGLGDDDRDVLAILATQAVIALQNARLHERALAQASEDGLTGLLNHRAFQARLEEAVLQARRARQPLALMMVDLDDFGAINNTYGHQTGDATLVAVATALRHSLRASDLAARYGGDEFSVILPATSLEAALATAERALAAITALVVTDEGTEVRVGVSIGVAAFPDHGDSRETLLRKADQAAYAAKHAGKGRVGRPEDAAFTFEHDPAALVSMLEHANLATVEALAAAVDAKDPYTRGHSQRVSAYAAALATAMGLAPGDVERVRLAGLLHDVGKIGVPDAILTKEGRLSRDEYAVIQQHPAIGERMLADVPFLREILPAVRHHHERWDGDGYPDRLVGETIPLDATILMVADTFDAMTSNRTYRPALPLGEARRRLREGSGAQFDPRVTAAFERALAGDTLTLLAGEPHAQRIHALAG